MSTPVRVLYVCGTGRAGSTLLSRLLGQIPGWFAAGEVRYVWERGILANRSCECGAPFGECGFWQSVVEAAHGATAEEVAHGVVSLEPSLLRTRHALSRKRRRNTAPDERHTPYLSALASMYPAIRDTSGANVIVDSSKLPAYASLVRSLPNVELHVVHLVRDSRAVAFSWGRERKLADGAAHKYMARQTVLRSSAVWQVDNAMSTRYFGASPERYLRVRYEDLVAAPRQTLERIATFAGHPGKSPQIDGNTATVGKGHAAAGNPNRFDDGVITLKMDEAWTTQMPTHDVATVTALTWSGLRRYGYRLAPSSS